jgi:multiple sugar transport system substrate-binding protein
MSGEQILLIDDTAPDILVARTGVVAHHGCRVTTIREDLQGPDEAVWHFSHVILLNVRLVSTITVALILWLVLLAMIWLTGCQGINLPAAVSSPTPAVSTIVPGPSPTLQVPPSPVPTVPSVITLTLWTAPDYSPQAEGPAGEVMRQLLATFNEIQEDVKIEYVLKKPQGKGGLLDFLLTASSVAPGVLPDLILLEPHALRDAARAELVQPLDELLPQSLQEDLFPFALEAGRFDGQLKGVQFQADVLHLLYNTNKVESPPLNWTDVLTYPQAYYLFPAGGQAGLATDSFLVHYLSTGAPLFDEIGQLVLDQEAMTAVLGYYATGIQAGVVPTTVLKLESILDCWPIYLEAQVATTEMIASHYLANRDVLHNTSYAALPGQTGPASTVSQGWMIALVAADASNLYRIEAATHFLEWWLSPENNANWNLAAGTLPVRRAAYQRLGEQDAYFTFLTGLLETAHPYPLAPVYREVAAAWQIAIEAVMTGEQTPEEAATQVMTSLGR